MDLYAKNCTRRYSGKGREAQIALRKVAIRVRLRRRYKFHE
jgi:hypothetical protein